MEVIQWKQGSFRRASWKLKSMLPPWTSLTLAKAETTRPTRLMNSPNLPWRSRSHWQHNYLPNLPIQVTATKEEWPGAERREGSLQVQEKARFMVKDPQLQEEVQLRERRMSDHAKTIADSERLQGPKKGTSVRNTCRVCWRASKTFSVRSNEYLKIKVSTMSILTWSLARLRDSTSVSNRNPLPCMHLQHKSQAHRSCLTESVSWSRIVPNSFCTNSNNKIGRIVRKRVRISKAHASEGQLTRQATRMQTWRS